MARWDWPPLWLALGIAAAAGAGALWPVPAPGLRPFGVGLIVAGLGLMARAAWTMWRAGATLNPQAPPTALVTHGVFRWSRNPIYLADLAVMLGAGLLLHPPTAPLLTLALAGVLTRRFIRREEAWLRARDPAGFAAWAARTRRWL